MGRIRLGLPLRLNQAMRNLRQIFGNPGSRVGGCAHSVANLEGQRPAVGVAQDDAAGARFGRRDDGLDGIVGIGAPARALARDGRHEPQRCSRCDGESGNVHAASLPSDARQRGFARRIQAGPQLPLVTCQYRVDAL